MATTSISLIREQSEAVGPPRALWVPFDLGRPLGVAGDPAFQTDVLRAAFALLGSASAPIIDDYPVEVPGEAGPGTWACPLPLPVPEEETLTDRLVAEVGRLAPWSAETRSQRSRTLFGATGAAPDQVVEVAQAVGQLAESGDLSEAPEVGIEWAFDMPILVRHLADDLRTFYHEAVAAQPGPGAPNHAALTEWIFSGTALGEALQTIADHLTELDTPIARLTRGLLIPEGHYRGGSAF